MLNPAMPVHTSKFWVLIILLMMYLMLDEYYNVYGMQSYPYELTIELKHVPIM